MYKKHSNGFASLAFNYFRMWIFPSTQPSPLHCHIFLFFLLGTLHKQTLFLDQYINQTQMHKFVFAVFLSFGFLTS